MKQQRFEELKALILKGHAIKDRWKSGAWFALPLSSLERQGFTKTELKSAARKGLIEQQIIRYRGSGGGGILSFVVPAPASAPEEEKKHDFEPVTKTNPS